MIPTQLPANIAQLVAQGAICCLNHSGGKDSQASLLVMRSLGIPDAQIRIVHAELPGVDWEGIPEHIQANSFGLPFKMRANPTTFEEKVEHRGRFPDKKRRWCTSDLKRGPLEAMIREFCPKGSVIIDIEGIRADESDERATYERFEELTDDKHRGNNRTWYKWRPIFDMTEAEVRQVVADAGQELHWAYQEGMSRLSCCFCIMSSKGDLETAYRLKPELAQRLGRLERQVNHTLAMVDPGKPRKFLDEMFDLGDETVAELAAARKARLAAEPVNEVSEVSETVGDDDSAIEPVAEIAKQPVYGLPLNPRHLLNELAGASFCISFATRDKLGSQLDQAIELVGEDQILLVDNGAFSMHKQGLDTRSEEYQAAYEAWAQEILDRCPQAIAVIPDVIGGTEGENAELINSSMLSFDRAMPIWHMHESISYLLHLCEGFGYVGIGSSGQFWKVGSPEWHARISEAFAAIDAWEASSQGAFIRPRLHMMRAQSMAHLYPFDTSDSTNVAMNHGRYRDQGEGYVAAFAARATAKIAASSGSQAEHQVKRPLLAHVEMANLAAELAARYPNTQPAAAFPGFFLNLCWHDHRDAVAYVPTRTWEAFDASVGLHAGFCRSALIDAARASAHA